MIYLILILFIIFLIEIIYNPRLIYNREYDYLILFYGKKKRDYIILIQF